MKQASSPQAPQKSAQPPFPCSRSSPLRFLRARSASKVTPTMSPSTPSSSPATGSSPPQDPRPSPAFFSNAAPSTQPTSPPPDTPSFTPSPATPPKTAACKTAASTSFFCDAQHFHNDALGPLPIKLRIEHPLPRPQVESALRHRQRRLMVQQQRLQMGIRIVFTRLMMPIARPSRRKLFQPDPNVLN